MVSQPNRFLPWGELVQRRVAITGLAQGTRVEVRVRVRRRGAAPSAWTTIQAGTRT